MSGKGAKPNDATENATPEENQGETKSNENVTPEETQGKTGVYALLLSKLKGNLDSLKKNKPSRTKSLLYGLIEEASTVLALCQAAGQLVSIKNTLKGIRVDKKKFDNKYDAALNEGDLSLLTSTESTTRMQTPDLEMLRNQLEANAPPAQCWRRGRHHGALEISDLLHKSTVSKKQGVALLIEADELKLHYDELATTLGTAPYYYAILPNVKDKKGLEQLSALADELLCFRNELHKFKEELTTDGFIAFKEYLFSKIERDRKAAGSSADHHPSLMFSSLLRKPSDEEIALGEKATEAMKDTAEESPETLILELLYYHRKDNSWSTPALELFLLDQSILTSLIQRAKSNPGLQPHLIEILDTGKFSKITYNNGVISRIFRFIGPFLELCKNSLSNKRVSVGRPNGDGGSEGVGRLKEGDGGSASQQQSLQPFNMAKPNDATENATPEENQGETKSNENVTPEETQGKTGVYALLLSKLKGNLDSLKKNKPSRTKSLLYGLIEEASTVLALCQAAGQLVSIKNTLKGIRVDKKKFDNKYDAALNEGDLSLLTSTESTTRMQTPDLEMLRNQLEANAPPAQCWRRGRHHGALEISDLLHKSTVSKKQGVALLIEADELKLHYDELATTLGTAPYYYAILPNVKDKKGLEQLSALADELLCFRNELHKFKEELTTDGFIAFKEYLFSKIERDRKAAGSSADHHPSLMFSSLLRKPSDEEIALGEKATEAMKDTAEESPETLILELLYYHRKDNSWSTPALELFLLDQSILTSLIQRAKSNPGLQPHLIEILDTGKFSKITYNNGVISRIFRFIGPFLELCKNSLSNKRVSVGRPNGDGGSEGVGRLKEGDGGSASQQQSLQPFNMAKQKEPKPKKVMPAQQKERKRKEEGFCVIS